MEARTITQLKATDLVRLRSFGLLTALSPEARAELLAQAETITLPACTAVIDLNGSVERLYLVVEGLVGLLMATDKGCQCLVDMLGAGQLVAEIGVFDGCKQPMMAQSITETRLVAIPAAAVRDALAGSPGFRRFLLSHQSERLRKVIRQIARLKLMTTPQRLGVYLVGLAGPRMGTATLHLPCERQTLAAMLGMCPEALSRAFRTLVQVGVNSQDRRDIKVESLDRLRAFTSVDPFRPMTHGEPKEVCDDVRPQMGRGARSRSTVILPPETQCPYRNSDDESLTEFCQGRLSEPPEALPLGCPLLLAQQELSPPPLENMLPCYEYEMVCRSPLFSKLPPAIVRSLLQKATLASLAPSEPIFLRGDLADRFFVVLAGRVKLFVVNAMGQESVIDVIGTGTTFAEAAMFGTGRMPVNAEAVSCTRLLIIPADALLGKIAEDIDIFLLMLSSLARRQRQLFEQLLDLKLRSPGRRLASMLLNMTTSDTGTESIRLLMTKVALASQLGITPESMSRNLNRLRRFGVSCNGPDITIADIGKLRSYCADNKSGA